MTNGELLIKMFPETQVGDVSGDFIRFTFDGVVGNSVEKKWWNTEYNGNISDIQPEINQWIPVSENGDKEDG